ncbi:MAG: response regulator [bacterium]|nr:response regulator [Candidatus Margulisiibacteriota bacterium]
MPKAKSILVVEDYPETLELFKKLLEVEGYVVTPAASGEQALELVSHKSFDLIVLDIMLPRVDGFEVCRRTKADPKTKKIPVIAVTAFDVPNIADRCQAVGANEVVLKPFEPGRLIAVLKKYL